MASKIQKEKALDHAIEIAKHYARSGRTQADYPDTILENCYKKILEIVNEIDQSDN